MSSAQRPEDEVSGTPTPQPTLHRSVSHGSHSFSPTETPQHHNQGTSYFSRPISPTPRHSTRVSMVRSVSATSTRRAVRSTSVSSSHATARGHRDDPEVLSEADEESDEDEKPEHTLRDHGKGIASDAAPQETEEHEEEQGGESDREEDPITVRDRQSMINSEHPFGLPIWKPALYKKSRTVTRYADEALHSVPSAQAERHLLPGNIFWTVCFGWWLALSCFAVAAVLHVVPMGGKRYSSLVYGLGWYVAWPFGKYVEGDLEDEVSTGEDEESSRSPTDRRWSAGSDGHTVRAHSPQHFQSESWNPVETTGLLAVPTSPRPGMAAPSKSYGATQVASIGVSKGSQSGDWLGKACFWLALVTVIAPLLLIVCVICWGLVVTIPMAKLNWALIKHMFQRPTSIRFCAAPPAVVISSPHLSDTSSPTSDDDDDEDEEPQFKHQRLAAGQAAPSGSPDSTVLLCTYRAVGMQYYKYTVGGVNILFVNLMPIVFFVIFDGFVIMPWVEKREHHGKHVPALLALIGSPAAIFMFSMASVIPLSYFIGMAVASISAQSSIGMGAVINATFGSIIEIILYSIALTQGKGHLVEGSIVGSLLAGVLLMPGMSMCSSALRRKEQRFNAKSAGVTSMMLIMAIIGILTPTLFYETYGTFQLVCTGCPEVHPPSVSAISSLVSSVAPSNAPWICDSCYYQHPDPVHDPFYQSTVKSLMFFCATILVLSYLIGLWFSLRTHASQIWQNPQQLLHPMELPTTNPGARPLSLYHKLQRAPSIARLNRKPSNIGSTAGSHSRSQTPVPKNIHIDCGGSQRRGSDYPNGSHGTQASTSLGHTTNNHTKPPLSPTLARRVSYATGPGGTALLESVDRTIKSSGLHPDMNTDDFTRAVAVATVSALRHQQTHPMQSPARARSSGGATVGGTVVGGAVVADEGAGGHGGHDAPSWSRTTSATVLLSCTFLYALIAELLVDVVDVILEGSGIDEKFLGVTLFALVPNTTEFMNAISFALNGNIALSMEIGSAYALQVCLLQIPAMVAFSAWYAPDRLGMVSDTFTLVFPRWDVLVIILSIFLMTYTYIEAKSNYHRGSILILSYLVLTSGFYFAPPTPENPDEESPVESLVLASSKYVMSLTFWQSTFLWVKSWVFAWP